MGNGEMSSRARMKAALMLGEVDRVPVVLHGVDPYNEEGWMAKDPTYKPLLDYVRRNCPGLWHGWSPDMGVFLSAAKIKSKGDSYTEGEHEINKHTIETPKGPLTSVHRRRIGYPFRLVKPYIIDEEDIDKFLSIPYEPLKPEVTSFFKEERKLGDKGMISTSAPEPLGMVAPLFHYESFVLRSLSEKDVIIELLDIMYERCREYLENLLNREVTTPVFWLVGPEYAAPPVFSPAYFEEFVVKYDAKLIRLTRKYGAQTIIHCHGSVNAILEKIASMRPSGLHPVEPPPLGDTPLSEAKKRIGDKVCLVGNIDIGDILTSSSEEMDKKVRMAIQEGGPRGLILSTSASPHWPSLPKKAFQNYVQLIESGLKYGKILT